jgi:hypothetical protein
MTFLNPFVLLGLAASAIPIILHLLNLRKLRTVEFSTLYFLKELQKTRIRRLKIKQLLLLILRTLLIVLIVLGFSRPTLTGSFGSASSTVRSSIILLLDDSYSMTANNERGEYFRQALESADRVLELLADGDEAFLVRLSQIAGNEVEAAPIPERNHAALRASLRELRPQPVYRSLNDALQYSGRLLSLTTNLNKEVYVISDFQEGVWQKKTPTKVTKGPVFPPNARFFLLPVGTETPHNLGIERVTIASAILEVGKPMLVKTLVRNASERAVKNHLMSVFLAGTRVAQKGISLEPGVSREVEFSVVPKATGFLHGSVEMEGDDLDFDNRRFFAVYVPDRIRVLLCGFSNDLRYLRLALAARTDEGRSPLVLSECSPERLSHTLLASADIAVLANASAFGPAQTTALRDFVNAGGGLIVFPGMQLQPTQFNSTLAATLQLPKIVGLEQTTKQPAADHTVPINEFQSVDLRHPLFQGMFEEQGKARTTRVIEAPMITTHVRYLLTALSLPIMTLSSGAPFLVEHPVGRGRALLFAVSATPDWSDFPLRTLFVPLLHRSASYLVGEQGQQAEVFAGETVTLNLTKTVVPTINIKAPDELITSIPRGSHSASLLRFTDTRTIGVYEVLSGNQTLSTFVVNMDPRESLTQPSPRHDIESHLEQVGIASSAITFLTESTDVQRVVLQGRFGVELWKYFTIAALLVALLEMLVARDQKRDFAALSPTPSSAS